MSKPSDPEKIVLTNKYYPNGLTTKSVYDYYIFNKEKILKECGNQPVLIFYMFDKNSDFTVKRNMNNKLIHLTSENYDNVISGYSISISKEISNNNMTDLIVLDIDPVHYNVQENKVKECVSDILKLFSSNKYKITNSSSGYHIYIKLKSPENLDSVREIVLKTLQKQLSQKYLINDRTSAKKLIDVKKEINIDLSSMYKKGSITVENSLNRNGLICKDVTKIIKSFNRDSCVIT